jgi:SNF2 family DNA or RNA helicase
MTPLKIGQEKNVVIYRLITCGTVEEKIYRRQIFKDSITDMIDDTLENNQKNTYFWSFQHNLE